MLHKKIVNVGGGGIKCPCCFPQNPKHKREAKRKLEKRVRLAMADDQAIREGEYFNYWTQLDPSDVTGSCKHDEKQEQWNKDAFGEIYICNNPAR